MSVHESNELSLREQEILKLVATGASNKEIAQKLVISPNTVKVHLRNIFTKIGVVSRTEAAMFAVQNGLVETRTPLNGFNSLPSTEIERTRKELLTQWVRRNRVVLALSLLLFLSLVVVLQLVQNQIQGSNVNVLPIPTEESRWKRLADMPTARAALAGASDGSKIYAIGGETEDGVTGIVEIYDIQTGAWLKGVGKPTAVKDIQAVMIGGKIYVPGGIKADGSPTDVVEVLNAVTGAWEIAAPMPTPLSDYAAIAYEGKLFAFGGWDGTESQDLVLFFDPNLNQWKTMPGLNYRRMSFGVAVIGNNAMMIGGWDGTNLQTEVEAYPLFEDDNIDPDENFELPEARYGIGIVSIFDNIYILGGHSPNTNEQESYGYHYSISSNQWGEVTSLPLKGISDSAVVWMGSNIYVIGGNIQDKFTRITYLYKALNIFFIPLVK